jgi:hypothetical protein
VPPFGALCWGVTASSAMAADLSDLRVSVAEAERLSMCGWLAGTDLGVSFCA